MSAIAETRYGKVEGVQREGLVVFKGVPYAAPPVAERRWLPPAPPDAWSGVRQAKWFGPVAPQNRPEGIDVLEGFSDDQPQGEDCLYLNVWTPGLDDARRPVMVWIHGGGFTIGSGSQAIYEGSTLARRGDVVVVTINYRLGPLGFLNLNEVTGGRIPATGCEGMLDQVAALEWVRDNIAAFGGNPGNVTIFGESAGGMSVGTLLGMPRAQGLFSKAIPQSGACHTALPLDRAVRVAERYIERLGIGAGDVDPLRAMAVPELLRASGSLGGDLSSFDSEIGGMPLQPVIDGHVLPRCPIDSVSGGSAAGVAVLVGSTLEEWKLFAGMGESPYTLDEPQLAGRLGRQLDAGDVERLLESYRKARSGRGAPVSPGELFVAIETDRVFRLPAIRLAERQLAHDSRVYNYLFTWTSPAAGGLLGACHALELPFVFGTHAMNDGMKAFAGAGPTADALATAIQDCWLAFARTGDPSNDTVGKVDAYGAEHRATLVLGETCAAESAPYDAERAAWDGIADQRIGSF